jgi:hypothetical protein
MTYGTGQSTEPGLMFVTYERRRRAGKNREKARYIRQVAPAKTGWLSC